MTHFQVLRLEVHRFWKDLEKMAHVFQADEWQQLSPSGSAAARDSHSAVWSPAADGMYIFGGNSYSRHLRSSDIEVHLMDSFHEAVIWSGCTWNCNWHEPLTGLVPPVPPVPQTSTTFWRGGERLNELDFYNRQAGCQWTRLDTSQPERCLNMFEHVRWRAKFGYKWILS